MALRITALLLALVFARSVVVQANDPDPLRWMLMYGLATAISVAAFIDRLPAAVAGGAAALFATGLAFRVSRLASTSLEAFSLTTMGTVEIEEVREAWGLLICLVWSLVLVFAGRRSAKA